MGKTSEELSSRRVACRRWSFASWTRDRVLLRATAFAVCCAVCLWSNSPHASAEVSEREARRIRQIVEAGKANYRAFNNFVCRLRIRIGTPQQSSSQTVPPIATELEAAEARWVRKGKKESYAIRVVRSTPTTGKHGEFVGGGFVFPGVFVHDDQYVMLRDPAPATDKDLLQVRVSDDVNGAPMEIMTTWNNYGIAYNDGGVIWVYLSDLFANVPKPREMMVALSTVREEGRRLEKMTISLGTKPPSRITVWTDPARGYLAVRTTLQFEGQTPLTAVITEARQFGKHWFPWKTRLLRTKTCTEVEVVELKLGAARDGDFAVDVPEKSILRRVADPTGKQIVLEQPRRVALGDVSKLLSNIDSQPARVGSPRLAPRKDRGRLWKWGLISVGAILVVAGLYFRFQRR